MSLAAWSTGCGPIKVAAFYDMDLLDTHMADCNAQFGATFHHHIAIKSNSISSMLVHAHT